MTTPIIKIFHVCDDYIVSIRDEEESVWAATYHTELHAKAHAMVLRKALAWAPPDPVETLAHEEMKEMAREWDHR
jgi:hypothetical protein